MGLIYDEFGSLWEGRELVGARESIRAAIPGLIKIWRTQNAGECYGSSIAEAYFHQRLTNKSLLGLISSIWL